MGAVKSAFWAGKSRIWVAKSRKNRQIGGLNGEKSRRRRDGDGEKSRKNREKLGKSRRKIEKMETGSGGFRWTIGALGRSVLGLLGVGRPVAAGGAAVDSSGAWHMWITCRFSLRQFCGSFPAWRWRVVLVCGSWWRGGSARVPWAWWGRAGIPSAWLRPGCFPGVLGALRLAGWALSGWRLGLLACWPCCGPDCVLSFVLLSASRLAAFWAWVFRSSWWLWRCYR